MASYRGVDYLLIDSLFNEEEKLVRQTARQFVDDRLMPVIQDCYRDGRFPSELIAEMGELGFFGANLDGYGCAGMSNVEYGLIMQELERGDSGLRSFVSVQGALVMYPILTYGTEEQKQQLAARAGSGRGDRLLRADRAGLRLEPRRHDDHGAARRRRLGAERREDLDHQRRRWPTWRWCGRAPRRGFAGSWWSAARPGYSTSDIHGKLSMRASVTSSLAFRRLPDSGLDAAAGGAGD